MQLGASLYYGLKFYLPICNGPYAKLFKIKLLTSRRLGAQCSKHASVLLIIAVMTMS